MPSGAGILLALALLWCSSPARATEDLTSLWLVGTLDGRLGGGEEFSPWRYRIRGQLRTFDAFDGTRQALVQNSLGRRLPGGFTLWGAYAYYQNNPSSIGSNRENRLWQQLDWTARGWEGGTLRTNTRLEQRWLSLFEDVGWRFRQQVRIDVPVRTGSRTDLIGALEGIWDLRDTDWTDRGLSQVRINVGAGFPVSASTRMQVIYQYQYRNLDGQEDLVNHILIFSFSHRPL
jgi:hypothetical protein